MIPAGAVADLQRFWQGPPQIFQGGGNPLLSGMILEFSAVATNDGPQLFADALMPQCDAERPSYRVPHSTIFLFTFLRQVQSGPGMVRLTPQSSGGKLLTFSSDSAIIAGRFVALVPPSPGLMPGEISALAPVQTRFRSSVGRSTAIHQRCTLRGGCGL